MSMEIKYFDNRKDWRKWLTDNFETANEIWLVFPNKSSGKKAFCTMTRLKKPFVSIGLTVR
jgi:uncharacterized protein YdeI (YjbR/CyaY-like superfamily)